jgi:predicted phage tail protein
MKSIRLHGALRKFGKSIDLDVSNPAMAIRALIANFGAEFESIIRQNKFQVIWGDRRKSKSISDDEVMLGSNENILHFVPVVEGQSGVVRAVTGIVLVVAGVFFKQPWMVSLGASMAIGGVAEMLAGTPKMSDYSQAEVAQRPSFVFNGAINTVAQGGPIPLVYGRYLVGTTVISAGIEVAQLPTDDPNGQPISGNPATPVTNFKSYF